MNTEKQYKAKNGYLYRWIVVGACFICCTSYGTFYTFGIFFKPIQEEFQWSYALTSSLQSIQVFVYVLSSLALGWATDRFGPRVPLLIGALCLGCGYVLCSKVQTLQDFYLYYSLTSIGSGISWALPLSTVQRWFDDGHRRGMALGITLSGIGMGTFAWAPTMSYVIQNHGWRKGYVVMGSISIAVLLLAALFMAAPRRSNAPIDLAENKGPHEGDSLVQWADSIEIGIALRTPQLWLICLIQALFNMGLFLIFVHVVPYAIQIGIDGIAAGKAMGLIGGFSVIGRIFTPTFIEKRLSAKWELGLLLCALGAAASVLYLNLVHTYWMLYLFVIIYGFFYGSWIPTVVALIGTYYGTRSLGAVLGVTQIGLIGGVLGPMLGGFVYDRLGHYPVAFSICAIAFACAGTISFLMNRPN